MLRGRERERRWILDERDYPDPAPAGSNAQGRRGRRPPAPQSGIAAAKWWPRWHSCHPTTAARMPPLRAGGPLHAVSLKWSRTAKKSDSSNTEHSYCSSTNRVAGHTQAGWEPAAGQGPAPRKCRNAKDRPGGLSYPLNFSLQPGEQKCTTRPSMVFLTEVAVET